MQYLSTLGRHCGGMCSPKLGTLQIYETLLPGRTVAPNQSCTRHDGSVRFCLMLKNLDIGTPFSILWYLLYSSMVFLPILLQVRPKMIMTLAASIMLWSLSSKGKVGDAPSSPTSQKSPLSPTPSDLSSPTSEPTSPVSFRTAEVLEIASSPPPSENGHDTSS
jgi:hypothetical protein